MENIVNCMRHRHPEALKTPFPPKVPGSPHLHHVDATSDGLKRVCNSKPQVIVAVDPQPSPWVRGLDTAYNVVHLHRWAIEGNDGGLVCFLEAWPVTDLRLTILRLKGLSRAMNQS